MMHFYTTMDAVFYQQKQDVMDLFSLDMASYDSIDHLESSSKMKKKRISDSMDSYWKTCPREVSTVAELRFHQDLTKEVHGMEYESSESSSMLEGILTGDVYLMNDLHDPLLGEAQDSTVPWIKNREETFINDGVLDIKEEPLTFPNEKNGPAIDNVKKENKSPSYGNDNVLLSHVPEYKTLDIRTEKHPLLEDDSTDSYSVKEDIDAYRASSSLDELNENHSPQQRFSSGDEDSYDNRPKRECNQMRIKRKSKKAEWPKPSYSYTCLITLAIKNSPKGALPVKQIYKFICEHFPYYQTAPIRWKNCVRHNLCQSNFFEKKPREAGGWVWTISEWKVYNVNAELTRFKTRNLKGIKKAMKYPHLLDSLEQGTVRLELESTDENQEVDSYSNNLNIQSSNEVIPSPVDDTQNNLESKKKLKEFIGRKYPKEVHYNLLPTPIMIENNNVKKSPINTEEKQEIPDIGPNCFQSSSPNDTEEEDDNLSVGEVKLEDLSFSEDQLLSAINFDNVDFDATSFDDIEDEEPNEVTSQPNDNTHNEASSFVSHIGKFNTSNSMNTSELKIEGLIDELSLDAEVSKFTSKPSNIVQAQSSPIMSKPQVILKVNKASPIYSQHNTQQIRVINPQINTNSQPETLNSFKYILQNTSAESGQPMRILTQQNTNKTSYPKPPYSYSCLIGLALKNSLNEGLLVSDIYAFMVKHFPYFSDEIAPSGWKNSVRHNLSTGKWFEKKQTAQGLNNKRSVLWAIVPEKREQVEEALRKFRSRELFEIKESMRYPDQLEALEEGRRKTVTPHNYKAYKIRPSNEDYHWDQHIRDTPVTQSATTRHQVVHTISSGSQLTQFPRFNSIPTIQNNVSYVTHIKTEDANFH